MNKFKVGEFVMVESTEDIVEYNGKIGKVSKVLDEGLEGFAELELGTYILVDLGNGEGVIGFWEDEVKKIQISLILEK